MNDNHEPPPLRGGLAALAADWDPPDPIVLIVHPERTPGQPAAVLADEVPGSEPFQSIGKVCDLVLPGETHPRLGPDPDLVEVTVHRIATGDVLIESDPPTAEGRPVVHLVNNGGEFSIEPDPPATADHPDDDAAPLTDDQRAELLDWLAHRHDTDGR